MNASSGTIGAETPVPRQPRASAELLDVREVAALLSCSTRSVYRLADAGKMPQPLKLGQLVRWRRTEVLDWIEGGCKPVRVARGGAR